MRTTTHINGLSNLYSAGILISIYVCLWGWVWNIVKLAGVVSDPLSGLIVLRIIGVIVAPLGVVLGFV